MRLWKEKEQQKRLHETAKQMERKKKSFLNQKLFHRLTRQKKKYS